MTWATALAELIEFALDLSLQTRRLARTIARAAQVLAAATATIANEHVLARRYRTLELELARQ